MPRAGRKEMTPIDVPTPALRLEQLTRDLRRASGRTLAVLAALLGVAVVGLSFSPIGTNGAIAALVAGSCVLTATFLGALIIGQAKGKPAGHVPMVVLAASCVRCMAALALAIMVFLAASLASTVFWATFLAGALAGLVLETLWDVAALNSYNASGAAAPASGALAS
jgi:hypothetical protein